MKDFMQLWITIVPWEGTLQNVGKAFCKQGLGTRDRQADLLGPLAWGYICTWEGMLGRHSVNRSLVPRQTGRPHRPGVHLKTPSDFLSLPCPFLDRLEVCWHLQSVSNLGDEQTVEWKGLWRILQARLVDPTAEEFFPLLILNNDPNKTGTASLSWHLLFH